MKKKAKFQTRVFHVNFLRSITIALKCSFLPFIKMIFILFYIYNISIALCIVIWDISIPIVENQRTVFSSQININF